MLKKTKIATGVFVALGGTLATGMLPAFAQTAERVEITGSSIRRVDAETALPVTVISRADIERTGATTAQDLVNLIPSNFGGGVVANNVGATGVASTANLRSLGSKYTLVLLNGRRVANFAFGNSPVDLNSIPLAAVDRVEVLRDGASAVYGADAVAGVINFILKKDFQGMEASVYATKPQKKGGESKTISLTGGFGDLGTDGFNVLVSAFTERDDVLKARDRKFAETADRPDLGINKASPRNGVPNFNFTDTSGNGYGSRGNKGSPIVNPFRYNGCANVEFSLVVRDATTCGTDYVKYIDLIPKQQYDNIVGRGTLALGNDHQLFAEAVYVKTSTTSTYSPAPYTVNMTYPANGRFYPKSIIVPKGATVGKAASTNTTTGVVTPAINYTLPNGTVLPGGSVLANDVTVTPTGPLSGTWRTVAGGGRTDITDTSTNRFSFGAEGTVAGWDYKGALTTSTNKGDIKFGPGQFSYALLTPLVNSGEINVFGSQDATSLGKLLSAQLTGLQQSANSKSTEVDFRVSRELFALPAGGVGFAIGGSFRTEKLDQVSYDVLASGDQVGGAGPIPSVTGDRKVYGLFTEIEIPIVKGLDLNLAARYDNYKNGFGTSFNNVSPKASLSYRPIKDILLRGSFGQGYRAPTLYENLRPFTSGNNTAANWSDPVRCPNGVPIDNSVGTIQDECNVQQPTALEGSKLLKPEKSDQFSLGIVFSPISEVSLSVDYWDVKIKQAIAAKSEIQVLGQPDAYKDFIYRFDPALYPDGWSDDGKATGAIKGSTNKNFPIAFIYLPYDNTAKFFAAGIDLNLQLKTKIPEVGSIGVTLDGTYYTKHGYQNFGEAAVSDAGNYKDFGPVPRWRHALTFAFGVGPVNVSLTNNYSTGYIDYVNSGIPFSATYPENRKVKAYSTWDTQVNWKIIKDLSLTLGVKNLLDQDPPSSRTETNFQTGYDASFTNPIGRAYYLRASYKFF
jgi:iron complex outermembrane recepter protein